MFDLMALAFQADITRVITFSMDREASMRTYNNLSIAEGFHPLSHHGNAAEKMDKLVQIQSYHTDVFAKFIDRLSKAKEGDGTVLDHSTILFGSNMSNSDRHNNDPLPAAILGHANGKIKGGQHLKYPQDSRFADLLVTLFDRNNIPVEKIGDSGGISSRRSDEACRFLHQRDLCMRLEFAVAVLAVIACLVVPGDAFGPSPAAEPSLLDAAERGDRAAALRCSPRVPISTRPVPTARPPSCTRRPTTISSWCAR